MPFLPLFVAVALVLSALAPAARAQQADDGTATPDLLSIVQDRGSLICGMIDRGPGLAEQDEDGHWQGFDADVCRALAAAVLSDPDAVTFTPLAAETAQDALTSGSVDLIARAPDPGLSANRDGIALAAVSFHDGLGFLVRRDLDAINARELDRVRLCTLADGRGERLLAGFFERARIAPDLRPLEDLDAVETAYAEGSCDARTGRSLSLASRRLALANPEAHRVLPDILTKEPFGPLVGSEDTRWLEVVRWTVFALLIAEELGVTRDNADVMRGDAGTAEARRLLGSEGEIGAQLGLDADWAYRLITATGNYAEVFDRTLGAGGPLGLERGLNALWRDGGLMHAPAMQ